MGFLPRLSSSAITETSLPAARANKLKIEIWPLDLECSAYINIRCATAVQKGIRKELGAYSEQGA